MAQYLKSTAYTRLFKMIDSTDHLSKKTGLTCTVNLSKAGATFGAAGGTITEIANGWYKVALTTTDTNTAGDLAFYITATGADDTDFSDQVVDPTVANLGVNVVNWNNTVVATPATAGIPDINVKNINNVAAATPGASGGILIAGSNAGTTTLAALTVTGTTTLSDGLVVARSSSNASAITATGNGTGNGATFTSGAGATGDGVQMTAASTNGNGCKNAGAGSGAGVVTNGGANGAGWSAAGGATSGSAFSGTTTSGDAMSLIAGTNGSGFASTGAGTGHGAKYTAGSTGSASGIFLTGGNAGLNIQPTAGVGISVVGGSGSAAVSVTGGSGAPGILTTGGATSGDGFKAVGTGTGVDIRGNITGNVIGTLTTVTTTTNLTNAPTAGDFTATMKTSIGTAVAASAVASVTAGVTVTTNSDKTGYALTSGERTSIADAYLDRADAIEVGMTPRQAHRLEAAASAGVLSGAATTTVTINNAIANSKARITATVDANGNRSAVTTDVT